MREAWRFLNDHKLIDVAVLVLITLLAAQGWLNSGLPRGHDALGNISASHDIGESLFKYHSAPEWIMQYLGYPPYLRPLLVEISLLVPSLALDWVASSKIVYFLLFALSGVFAYYFVYEIARNRLAGFVAGLTYAFVPFHLIEVVFEGHWDIGAAYMLVPLVFLVTERAISGCRAKTIVAAGFLLALLILTHAQVLPLLIGPFLGLYAVFRLGSVVGQGRRKLRDAAIACFGLFAIGMLLSAFWWLPLLREVDYFESSKFSLETAESGPFSATFVQAVTLRPNSCCAPSSAYAVSGGVGQQMLQLFPVAFAVLGLAFNYRNKYAWFFFVSALLAIFLAMGPESPADLYGFAYNHVPVFSGMRTPARFLLFASFSYAVLAGFFLAAVGKWLKHFRLPLLVLMLFSLAVLANTWQESRAAFETFRLTSDQQGAIEWLRSHDEGRVMTIPLAPYKYSQELGNTYNPMRFTWMHGKTVLCGARTKWAVDYLDMVYWAATTQRTNVGEISDMLGVKYAVVDKTDPTCANYVLDDSFVKVWESDTMDIYENNGLYSNVLVNVPMDKVDLDLRGWSWAAGTQYPAQVAISHDYAVSQGHSWKSDYIFDREGLNSLSIGTDIEMPREATTLFFWFYLPEHLPNVTIRAMLWESDGSVYSYDLFGDMSSGWHEAEVSLSGIGAHLLIEDDNAQLDKEQVSRFSIGVDEVKEDATLHKFSVYFSQIILSTDWEAQLTGWQWAQGNQYPPQVTPSVEYILDSHYSWRSDYVFDKRGYNWLNIATDIEVPQEAGTVSFWYYSPGSLPDVTMTAMLLESDDSAYTYDSVGCLSPGWHKVDMPLSAFHLDWWSSDENGRLDKEQVSRLGISVGEDKEDEPPHEFSLYFSRVRVSAKWEVQLGGWQWVDGTQPSERVTISGERAMNLDYSWRSDYKFDREGLNWLGIAADVRMPQGATTMSFSYYLPEDLLDVTMTAMLFESDGSKYDYVLPEDMSSGWHTVEVPLSLMCLRYSEDENAQLDRAQVSQFGVEVSENEPCKTSHNFSVYWGRELWVCTDRMENVDFSLVHPGEYEVQVNCAEPCALILDESYYPGWVAKIDGRTVESERTYGFLNGWQIDEPGQHEVTLQFTPSALRVKARVVSSLTAIGIIAVFGFLAVRHRRNKRGNGP